MGIFTAIAGFVGGPIIKGFLSAYRDKLAAENTKDRLAADIAMASIDARIVRTQARRDLGLMAMTHPIWWFAWALFVIPVGLYHATIYAVSTLGIPPCTGNIIEDCYTVLAVPKEQAEVGRIIVRNIFFAQGTLGLAGAVMKRFMKK